MFLLQGDFGGPVLSKVTQADQTVRWKQVGVNSKFTRCVDYQGGPGGTFFSSLDIMLETRNLQFHSILSSTSHS
jgi:hypothetical protein